MMFDVCGLSSEKMDKDNLHAFFIILQSQFSVFFFDSFFFILKGTGGSVDTGWDPDLAEGSAKPPASCKAVAGSWPVEQLRTRGKVVHSD